MLGMVFTEFLEMVEERFSPALADRLLLAARTPHGGAYTAVGHYPHDEMVRLLHALADETGVPVAALLRGFGEYLFARLAAGYPPLTAAHRDLFSLLAGLDDCIHPEVQKLYPKAQLPRFRVLARDAQHLLLRYDSPRRMEDFAVGLITGAAAHFHEPVVVSVAVTDAEADAHVRIRVARRAADDAH